MLGRYGADANLTTIYRLFFKVGTVQWILARASQQTQCGPHADGDLVFVAPVVRGTASPTGPR